MRVVFLDLGNDGIAERTALCGYILFLNEVVDKGAHHVIFIV